MINPNTRVNQLDATLLDQELLSILMKQCSSVLNKISPVYSHKFNNEAELILKTILFKLTIIDKNQTYGLFLQNLKYKDLTNLKKLQYYFVFIFGYYASTKLQGFIYGDDDESDDHKIVSILKRIYIKASKCYKVLSLLNFVDFFITGNYQSLPLRLLNIKTQIFSTELAKTNKGNVSFEFQNRQLIWNTFLEFILFILPILSNSSVQQSFQKLLNPKTIEQSSVNFAHLKEKQCAICLQNNSNEYYDYAITNPYLTNCQHIYCYVCLLNKLDAAEKYRQPWNCLRCGSKVEYIKPFYDIEETTEDIEKLE